MDYILSSLSISYSAFWAIIGIFLFFLEIVVPGVFLVFFAFGAIITALITLIIPISINIQLLIFVTTSIFTLAIFRKKIKNLLNKNKLHIDGEILSKNRFVNQEVVVLEDITDKEGSVELNGTVWSARSKKGSFKKGDLVRVIDIKNLVLWVQ